MDRQPNKHTQAGLGTASRGKGVRFPLSLVVDIGGLEVAVLTAVAQVVLAVKLGEVVEWPVVASGDGSFKRSASE